MNLGIGEGQRGETGGSGGRKGNNQNVVYERRMHLRRKNVGDGDLNLGSQT